MPLDLGESRVNPELRRVEVAEDQVENAGRRLMETLAGPPLWFREEWKGFSIQSIWETPG